MNEKFLSNIGKIHSRFTTDFGPLIYGLIKAVRPGLIVETGTCQGYLTAWLALGALEVKSKLITIDWYKEIWPHASPGSFTAVRKNLDSCGVLEGVTELVVGEALHTLIDKGTKGKLSNLGICILDDYHEYNHLRTEIDTVWRYLVPGGFILVHDVCVKGMEEINRAVNDSIAHYEINRNLWLFRSQGYCILQKNW